MAIHLWYHRRLPRDHQRSRSARLFHVTHTIVRPSWHRVPDHPGRYGGFHIRRVDGRGLAAALVLGAQGVNIRTRFLASTEASCGEGWKQMILAAHSEDTISAEVFNDIMPLPGTGGYGTVPRAIRTPFIEKWQGDRNQARQQASELQIQVREAISQARFHEFVPFAGQSAGMHDR